MAEKTAYPLEAKAKLPGIKTDGSWRFKKADVEAWFSEQKGNVQGKG